MMSVSDHITVGTNISQTPISIFRDSKMGEVIDLKIEVFSSSTLK